MNNKLILPITILIACIILGGFYYATEVSKSNSIERQAKAAQDEKDKEARDAQTKQAAIAQQKGWCVAEAQTEAVNEYESSYLCTGSYAPATCFDSKTYEVASYNTQYNTCLQRDGIN